MRKRTKQYAIFLSVLGQPDRALAEVTRALELAPLSLQTNLNVGWAYLFAGRADLLFEQGRKLNELEPSFFGGHWLLGVKLWLEGTYEQALTEFEAAVALDGGPSPLGFLGSLYGIMGKREKAQQALEELQAPGVQRDGRRLYIAQVYAGLGELDRAFDLLEQAYKQREGVLVCLKYIALFTPGLSGDPRFDDLLRRIGLPQ